VVHRRARAVELFSTATLADRPRQERWYDEIFSLAKDSGSATIVDVGVALGGSLGIFCRAIADCIEDQSDSELIGFDKFEAPYDYSDVDQESGDFTSKLASEVSLMNRRRVPVEAKDLWCSAALGTIHSSGFEGRITLIQGDASTTVEEFVEERESDLRISALRISCNWYAPVLSAMTHLVPRVIPSGVIFLDGYFFWSGFRRAVTESLGLKVEEAGQRIGDCLVLFPSDRG